MFSYYLLSDNKKSYIPRQLAQQLMTLSDLEWTFRGSCTLKSTWSASRAISAVAELLVFCLRKNIFKHSLFILLRCIQRWRVPSMARKYIYYKRTTLLRSTWLVIESPRMTIKAFLSSLRVVMATDVRRFSTRT